jgi:hypothetical protein
MVGKRSHHVDATRRRTLFIKLARNLSLYFMRWAFHLTPSPPLSLSLPPSLPPWLKGDILKNVVAKFASFV